ncbi:MAG TPA: glycosyltransferase family 4 protein [bacterium]|nr:glycosyltransferase family 4 protein [bacterium]
MKILATADIFSARNFGGGTRHFLGACSSLARRGHSVSAMLPCLHDENILISRFPEIDFILYSAGDDTPSFTSTVLKSKTTFRNCIRTGGYDLLQLNQPRTSIGPALLGGGISAPIVYHFQSSWATEYQIKTEGSKNWQYHARRLVEEAILKKCSKALVLSEYVKDKLLSTYRWVNPEAVKIISGGVDTTVFKPASDKKEVRCSIGLPADRPILFSARFFSPRYGISNLINAMKIVAAKQPDVLLVLSGRGPQKSAMLKLAADLGISKNILFTDFIDEAVFPDYYRAADLFVLPTQELEGFGLVTIESLACGVPVVGTPVGATVEIFNRFDPSFLTPDASAEGIAEGILYWLNRYDELPDFGAKGREHVVANYSWDVIAEQLESFYLEAGRTPALYGK